MKILNQNLQEGQKQGEESKRKPEQTKSTMTPRERKSQSRPTQVKSTAVITLPKETKQPRTTIKFAFTMDSFVIDLLNTVSVSIIFYLYLVG